MITVKYSNEIRIDTGDLSHAFTKDQLPLRFNVVKSVNDDIIWGVDLDSNMWATYPTPELNDVLVTDKIGNEIHRYQWNVFEHGSIFHKALYFYCYNLINKGITPQGVAIGTHNGEFGEWVPVALDTLSNILLVEGSEKQFEELMGNYRLNKNVSWMNEIITPDGKSMTFYEGGRGYTNSVVERVIRNWETEEIHSTIRETISINQIVNENIHWLHLDVEGLDAKLIMALEILPKMIIFEHENLEPGEQDIVNRWLRERKYSIVSEGGISIATKI
jgi:hypothetical protein